VLDTSFLCKTLLRVVSRIYHVVYPLIQRFGLGYPNFSVLDTSFLCKTLLRVVSRIYHVVYPLIQRFKASLALIVSGLTPAVGAVSHFSASSRNVSSHGHVETLATMGAFLNLPLIRHRMYQMLRMGYHCRSLLPTLELVCRDC
jgi:hypothetical protein